VSSDRLPTNLIEAVRYFADQDVCVQFVAKLRWDNGPVCPACGGLEHSYLTTRRIWKCKNKDCRKQFSVKVGTIFEDSAIPLDKWLCAIWLIANSKNGISSHELGRSIGLTQKSAWFVLHRIRLAMQTGTFKRLDGEVEVDETFVGGLAGNMHKHKAAQAHMGRGNKDKAIIVGARERGGEIRAQVVPDRKRHSLVAFVEDNVEPGAQIYTDEHTAYMALKWEGYKHQAINHSKGSYVDGKISTNGIENFWSLLKRGIHGTYVQVNAEHLFRYVDERLFTYNEREDSDLGRFRTVLSRIAGRRLTYAELTAS
jgi:transposase-like protein